MRVFVQAHTERGTPFDPSDASFALLAENRGGRVGWCGVARGCCAVLCVFVFVRFGGRQSEALPLSY